MNKKHLENIAIILKEFLSKFNFNASYLKVSGQIEVDVYSDINIDCISEFDNLTNKEIKKIKEDAYEVVRKYLEDNKINYIIYIEPEKTIRGTYYSGFNIYYRTNFYLSL